MNELATPKNGSFTNDNALVPPTASKVPATQSPPADLALKKQALVAGLQRKAFAIRELAFPAAMATAIPVAKEVGAAAFKVAQDWLLEAAGKPSDPVEIMLLQQINLGHHRVAQLHAQAQEAKSIEAVKVYTTAAARLTGEVRRLALALKQYREPSSKKQFMVVRQQNVSTGGQQVAYLDQSGPPQGQIPFISVGEQGNTKRLEHATQVTFAPKSQTAGGRQAEPSLARPADSRGAGATSTSGPCESALDVLYGAKDGGGQGQIGSERSMAAEG